MPKIAVLNDFRPAQGAILKKARTNLRFSQREVSEKILVTAQTILNWEKGISSPTCEDIKKLAEIYNCAIGDLFPS